MRVHLGASSLACSHGIHIGSAHLVAWRAQGAAAAADLDGTCMLHRHRSSTPTSFFIYVYINVCMFMSSMYMHNNDGGQ